MRAPLRPARVVVFVALVVLAPGRAPQAADAVPGAQGVAAGGTATGASDGGAVPVPEPVPAPVPAAAIPPFPQAPAFAPLRRERHVTIERTELTYRLVDGREIEGWGADLYAPREAAPRPGSDGAPSGPALPPTRRPLIVMLPAGGIRADLTADWAESFARSGFLALVLHWLPDSADEGIGHSLKGTAKTFSQDATNLRRTVEWAATLPGVDPRRIGVLGVSRGAIATALVAQTSPYLSSVIVLGAADLTGLFRDSDFKVIKKMRTRELERTQGGLDAAVARAAKVLGPVDPASYPGRLDPERTLLINARWDHVFPKPQALALRRAAGNARQEWLSCGHYGTLLFAGRVRRLALEHFKATLGDPASNRGAAAPENGSAAQPDGGPRPRRAP